MTRHEQILKYLPVVHKIVNQMVKRMPASIDREELISLGTIGMISALDRFDETRNVKIETFISCRIRGAILDWLRTNDNATTTERRKNNLLVKTIARLQSELGRVPTDIEIADSLSMTLNDFYAYQDSVRVASVDKIDDLRADYVESHVSAEVEPDHDPLQIALENEFQRSVRGMIGALPDRVEGLRYGSFSLLL